MFVHIIRGDRGSLGFPADADLRKVLEAVAQGTDTQSLVVDIYLLANCSIWRGDCRQPRHRVGPEGRALVANSLQIVRRVPETRSPSRIFASSLAISGSVVERSRPGMGCT